MRVFPDQSVWDTCVEKATKLFRMAILPELVGNWTSNLALSPQKQPSLSSETRVRILWNVFQKREKLNFSKVFLAKETRECGRGEGDGGGELGGG